MTKTKTYQWDPSEDLNTPESIAHYLEAALEDGDCQVIAAVLGDIARSRGMASIAEATGLGRERVFINHYLNLVILSSQQCLRLFRLWV